MILLEVTVSSGFRPNRCGSRAQDEGTVPKLAEFIVSPALHIPREHHRTVVYPAGCDIQHSGEIVDNNRTHPRVRVPFAELPVSVISPALHGVIIHQGAGMVVAAPNPHRQGHTPGIDWNGAVVGTTVTELTTVVFAPALHPALGLEHRTGVRAASANGDGVGDVAHCLWRTFAIARNVCLKLVVAELPRVTHAPTLDRAAGQERTGVLDARRDFDRAGDVRHEAREVVRGIETRLAISLGPPTLDAARGQNRTGMLLASANLHRVADARHRLGPIPINAGIEVTAELTVIIASPTVDITAPGPTAGVVLASRNLYEGGRPPNIARHLQNANVSQAELPVLVVAPALSLSDPANGARMAPLRGNLVERSGLDAGGGIGPLIGSADLLHDAPVIGAAWRLARAGVIRRAGLRVEAGDIVET